MIDARQATAVADVRRAGIALARAFDERHRFRVTEEITLPKGRSPSWLMWREPRG